VRKRPTRPPTRRGRRKEILKLKDQDARQRKARVTVDAAKLQQAGLAFTSKQFWIASAVFGLSSPRCSLPFGKIAAGRLAWPSPPVSACRAGSSAPWPRRGIKKFTEEFSDAIDIIVRGIKSGLPVHDCLKIIGKEMPRAARAGEFQPPGRERGHGHAARSGAGEDVRAHADAELRFFAIVSGDPAEDRRQPGRGAEQSVRRAARRKLMREKIKALSSEATASAASSAACRPAS
jgi:tight adherence protein B